MTLPSSVLTALRFWKSTTPHQVIWNTTGVVTNDLPSNVSSGDVTAITNALDDIYAKSPTYFQPVIDTFITNGGLIRIGSTSTVLVGGSVTDPSIDNYVVFDLTDIPHLYYFGTGGKLVPEIAGLTVAHELIHNILGLTDPAAGTELQMNGASWDFLGDTVRLQNQIVDEAGYWDNGQTNYLQAMMDTWAIFSEFQTGFSYSSDREVSISRYGTAGADLIDHSNRTDNSNDLLFGLAGVDTIKGGTGDDSLWGGTANDVLEGGDGDDLLSGDGGSDSIDGGVGTDIVSYELETQSVTLVLHGVGAHGGGATGDTITNVESVIGSNYSDTISLAGGTAVSTI